MRPAGHHRAFDASDTAGERERVAELADEVGHRHDGRGRFGAERVERRPEDEDVAAPPDNRTQQARFARAHEGERTADTCRHGSRDGGIPATEPRSRSSEDQGDEEAGRDHARAEHRRHDRERERCFARKPSGSESDASDHERRHEHAVEDGEERGQADHHRTPTQSHASQRPRRERDATRARGREEPGRGDAGERDAPAGAMADAGDDVQEDGVAGEGEHLEGCRQRDPRRITVAQPSPRVVEPSHPRHQEVEHGDGCDCTSAEQRE